MTPFVFNTTPSIVFEPGAAARLGAIAGARLGARVLLVTDPGLRRLGLCHAAIASLTDSGAVVTVFDAVEADPSRATLETADAMKQQRLLVNNPRTVSEADALAIYRAAW